MIIGFALFVAVLLGVLLFLDFFAFPMPQAALALGGELTAAQGEAIRLLNGQSAFLVSITLAIFGGCAAIVLDRSKAGPGIGRTGLFCLAAVIACSAFSIFFSHMLVVRVTEMLANDFLVLMSPAIVWSFRLQYASLLGALVFASLFVMTEVLVVRRPSDDRD